MSIEQKYIKDRSLSDSVTKTKVSHGRIETTIKVRQAKSKKELDLELKRLNILNEIDKSTIGKNLSIPTNPKNQTFIYICILYIFIHIIYRR